ncbi:hypothetical protein PG2006B_0633 [Bifidobacterium animalis subsp. animalis]|nr:hypothetical protein PG2006B_0633 [Bifidobacterium animalis subsp. animalis]
MLVAVGGNFAMPAAKRIRSRAYATGVRCAALWLY